LKQSESSAEPDTTRRALAGTNGHAHASNGISPGKSSKNGVAQQRFDLPDDMGSGVESPDKISAPADGAGGSSAPDADSPAFELKFLVDDERAAEVERWARGFLVGDVYGDPVLGGAYRTTSLYCDTPELDVYHRAAWYRRRKFRIRSYAGSPQLFLERKTRRGDRVAKRRTSIAAEQLPRLAEAEAEKDWLGYWFHRRVAKRRLGPACQIVYQRTAFVGVDPLSGLRLTLDREIHGTLTDDWSLSAAAGGIRLLAGQVILELKFRSGMPAEFKQLIAAMNLNATSVSKYRLCRDVWLSSDRAAESGNA
jgi:hypothetical protein